MRGRSPEQLGSGAGVSPAKLVTVDEQELEKEWLPLRAQLAQTAADRRVKGFELCGDSGTGILPVSCNGGVSESSAGVLPVLDGVSPARSAPSLHHSTTPIPNPAGSSLLPNPILPSSLDTCDDLLLWQLATN